MFEQESYSQDVPAVPTQPGDLFYNYEIRNWNFTPRLYKILAGSAIFNVLALIVIGSSGMLTTRGCESPFVGRVCQVLDTVYVGSLIFGTESEFDDFDYTKTELEDADVTFVDVTGVAPPLTYPAGYFALANPEQQFSNVTDPMMGPGYLAPGIPSSNPTIGGSGLINTPAIKPNANPNAVEGALPTDGPLGASTEDPTTPVKGKGPRGGRVKDPKTVADANTNSANSNTGDKTAAANTEEVKEDQWGVFITKRPMKDKAPDSLAKIKSEAIKIDTPFKVAISATLGPGKDPRTVVLKNPKPIPSETSTNNPEMVKFVQEWILAVGDAGWFGYLTRIDPKPKNVVITVEQNDTEFIASVKADQPTEEKAKAQASSLNLLLQGAVLIAKGDDQTFLQKASVVPDGKSFVLSFKIPKSEVNGLIMRKLSEEEQKKAKPEGSAFSKPSNNTAER